MKKNILFIFILLLSTHFIFAQHEKCNSFTLLQDEIKANPERGKALQEIELYTQNYIKNHTELKQQNKKSRAVRTIPVVVHVFHNGEVIGTGANISDAQILSQIDALNEDYRLKNADSLPTSHPFWNYTADCEIEFCLAIKDPNGAATTGINRYNIGQSTVNNTYMQGTGKPNTIWDRNKYLNLWVVTFSSSTLLGYAQFPGGAANTDGVVISNTAFGYIGSVVPPFDNGRTAAHEIGHWLNLRHIWGDSFCGDDLVGDTPTAEGQNGGCPTFPHNANNSCGTGANGEMYMNYMDYCDDACIVMFTFGQKARMDATLSGARSSLLSSTACNGAVAIQDVDQQNRYSIFPNPVIDNAMLYCYGNQTIKKYVLTDCTGKKIKEQLVNTQNNNKIEINLNQVPAGIYMLTVYTPQQVKTLKLIKK